MRRSALTGRAVRVRAEYEFQYKGGPLGHRLTPLELRALAGIARWADHREAADHLEVTLGALHAALDRTYAKLGTHSAIESFRVLGWLRLPNDGPPIPLVTAGPR